LGIDEVASNDNRSRVLRLVSMLPGVHLRELHRLLGISFNSARYNASKLCSTGEIQGFKESGYLRLYPAGTSARQRSIYAVLRNRVPNSILRILVEENGGATHKQLCQATGLAKSTVSENVQRLVELGIVKISLSDQRVSYSLEDHEEIRRALDECKEGPISSPTDRFVDLWDF
jgi:predicted transcriptional regulator